MRRLFSGDNRRDDQVQARKAMQAHSTGQSTAASMANKSGQGVYSVDYLQEIMPDSTNLDTDTVELLSMMLNEAWVLSNLKGSEVEELKWLKRALKKKILAFHPPSNHPLQGEYRKFMLDDSDDGLSALSARQKSELDQLLYLAFALDPRSRDGWQQKDVLGTIHTTSEYKDNSKSESKGLFSFR